MVMNFSTLKATNEWPGQEIIFCLAVDPNRHRLWFGCSDAAVYYLPLNEEKAERVNLEGEGHSSYVTGAVLDGQKLITSGYDKKLVWWDTESGQQIKAITAHDSWIRRIALTPDHRVISVGDDMQCRVWDAANGETLGSFTDHEKMTPHHYPSMLYALDISSDGSCIATGDRVGHIAIWNSQTLEKTAELETPEMYTWDPKQRRHSIGGIRSLAFSPDKTKLAVGGMGKVGNIDHLDGPSRIEVFDINSGERIQMMEDSKNKGLVEQMQWSPDGKQLLSVGGNHKGFISVHEVETGEQSHIVEHSGHIHAFSTDFENQVIITAAHQRLARWSFQSEDPQTQETKSLNKGDEEANNS